MFNLSYEKWATFNPQHHIKVKKERDSFTLCNLGTQEKLPLVN